MRKHLFMSLAALAVAVATIPGASHATATFGSPVRLVGGNGFEPMINIGPDGTIFVDEPPGLPAHSELWRSTNGGVSYTRTAWPSPYSRLPGGGDSDTAIGHDGRVYFTDLWLGSNSLARSDTNGTTWSWGTPFTTLPPSDRQWISVGPKLPNGQEIVYMSYRLISASTTTVGTATYPAFARSMDSGTTWTWHTLPMLPPNGLGGGHLVSDDTGLVAFVYREAGRTSVAYSHDTGNTWSRALVSDPNTQTNGIQSLALDGNSLHLVWSDNDAFSIKYARSLDRGVTWSAPVKVSTGGSNVFPWVAARGGKVAIAWYAADTATPTDPNRVPASQEWFARYTESIDGGSTFAAPVNAWGSSVKQGVVCTRGLSCEGGRELGDFLSIAIDGSSKSFIAFGNAHPLTSPRGTLVIKQN